MTERWVRPSSGVRLLAGVAGAVAFAATSVAGAGVADGSVRVGSDVALTSAVAGRGPHVQGNSASAAVPPKGHGTGPGYCTGYAGGATSPYSFDDVYACQGSTTGATTFDNPGTGVYAW